MRRWVTVALVLAGAGVAWAGEYETLRQKILDSVEAGRFDAALSLLEDAMRYEADFDAQLRMVATHLLKVDCQFERALEHGKKAALAARIADDQDLMDTADLIAREIQGSFGRATVTVRLVGDDWEALPGGRTPPRVVAAEAPLDEEQRACQAKGVAAVARIAQAWPTVDAPDEVPAPTLTARVWLPIGEYTVDGVPFRVAPDGDVTAEVVRAPRAEAEAAPAAASGGPSTSTWVWIAVGVAAVIGGGAAYALTREDPAATPASSVDIRDMPVFPR